MIDDSHNPALRRGRLLVALVAAALILLTACDGPSSEKGEGAVTVSGDPGQPPALEYTAPLKVSGSTVETIWPGTGRAVEAGRPVLVNIYAEDGRDRSVLQNTFTDAPAWYTLTTESMGDMARALSGQHVGARMLFVTESDRVPVVATIDILPTRADGTEVPPVDGLPTVTRAANGAPQISVPKTAPPTDLTVQPLIRGTGVQVEAGQIVTVRYTGVSWSTGKAFDTNWTDDQPPTSTMAGIGEVIDGWDQGLIEQAVGSQVMLIVPPDLGYGGTSSPLSDQTLVYVVDILDSHVPVQDEAPATEEQK